MIKLNRAIIEDKIYACWIGKNIGGTIGTPYEGSLEFRDVKGFVTEKGAPLPNDDLDLQLIWLCAMEIEGPYNMSPSILAEYWTNYITPHWNEYGVGKSNLRACCLPPLSGEINNAKWKTSNGAWIRSEIWACLAPGMPEIAAKYAYMDACVDHGLSEGTYAELFTAYLESLAFFLNDIREIINKALTAIPENCRVAKSVRTAIDAYEKGVSLREAREICVNESKDMGWFQAPNNLAFVVLGLLYGEGDFKKSMLSAVNCGDDTDCTGATVGAFLGILFGTAGIPEDWREYIGDRIISVAIDSSYRKVPTTCRELTERTIRMIPAILKAHGIDLEFTEGETEISEALGITSKIPSPLTGKTPYSYEVQTPPYVGASVHFDVEPIIKPLCEIRARVHFTNKFPDPKNLNIKLHLPEGLFATDYRRSIYLDHIDLSGTDWDVTIHAGENVNSMNRVIVEATCPGRPTPVLIPINLLG